MGDPKPLDLLPRSGRVSTDSSDDTPPAPPPGSAPATATPAAGSTTAAAATSTPTTSPSGRRVRRTDRVETPRPKPLPEEHTPYALPGLTPGTSASTGGTPTTANPSAPAAADTTLPPAPRHDGPLDAGDLKYLAVNCGITLGKGKVDAEDYRKIATLFARDTLTVPERALLLRLQAAASENLAVEVDGKPIRVDVDTPTTAEMTGLMRRHGVTVTTFPALIDELSAKLIAAGDAVSRDDVDMLRRLIQADGKSITLPGASAPVQVTSRFTARDLLLLERRFAEDGVSINDGSIGADDLENIGRGMARLRLSETERLLLTSRLTAVNGAYEVPGVGPMKRIVKIDVRSATAKDLEILEKIYGIDLSGGTLRADHIVDLMRQQQEGGMPRGIRDLYLKLARGSTVPAESLALFIDQAEQRLASIRESPRPTDPTMAEAWERDREAAKKASERLKKLPNPALDPVRDRETLLFLERVLSANRSTPWDQALVLRLSASEGQTIDRGNGKKVKVHLEGEVEVRVKPKAQDDQEAHDAITRESRRERALTFRYEGGRYVLELGSGDEADGNHFTGQIFARSDFKGGGGRLKWNSRVPVHPDVWLGVQLGIGAAYEQIYTNTPDGKKERTHHIGLEGTGGVDMLWYMSRRLGMTLRAEAHVDAHAHMQFNNSTANASGNAAQDAARTAAKELWDSYKADVDAMLDTVSADARAQIRTIVQQELQTLSTQLGPLLFNRVLAGTTTGTADDTAADAATQAAFQAAFTNIDTRATGVLGTAWTTLRPQLQARTTRLLQDAGKAAKGLLDSVGDDIPLPFNFGWGVTVGGSLTWKARLPLYSGKGLGVYIAPQVSVYGSAPVAGSGNMPMITGERDPSVARLGLRAVVGPEFRLGPFTYLRAGVGIDQSWQLGEMQAGRGRAEQTQLIADAGLLWRW